MSVECEVNIKSQSELDISGRESCWVFCHVEITTTVESKRTHNDPMMFETRLSKFFCPKMKLLKFEHLFWINRRHQISSFNMAHLAYQHKQLKL